MLLQSSEHCHFKPRVTTYEAYYIVFHADDMEDEPEESPTEARGLKLKCIWPQFKYYHIDASALRLDEVAALREAYLKLAEFSSNS